MFFEVSKSFLILRLGIVGTNAANNTTQFENFTIEWEDFSILTCAVPTTYRVSLLSCPLRNGSIQVQDISCLQQVTIDFDQSTCQASMTGATSAVWTRVSTQQPQVYENDRENNWLDDII